MKHTGVTVRTLGCQRAVAGTYLGAPVLRYCFVEQQR